MTIGDLSRIAGRLGLEVELTEVHASSGSQRWPLIVQAANLTSGDEQALECEWLVLLQVDGADVTFSRFGHKTLQRQRLADLQPKLTGLALLVSAAPPTVIDPDSAATQKRTFGFSWFVPELLKHRPIWRDVLLASLVLQLIALAFPLFTQAIIDKVVVHRTQSTLIALTVGMGVFVVFTTILTWVRQYLILHTGNRVDAVLGSTVFEHLFKLPPLYFQHRPTGVVAARLQGVETIREFVSSAAVTLVLDLPFLLIFVAIMFWYSVMLTLIVMAILALIVAASLLVAPLFQQRLNEQFLRGAASQAFVTEYVAGVETVKSLQLEPQLNRRYRDLLAAFLQASFRTRQLGNSYGVLSNGLEQIMSLLVLVCGAWLVMNEVAFTVGMLVAFQMFASRLSQPMLRLVGLWQQFQQAKVAVVRLGDVMNAPVEPYSLSQSRTQAGKGAVHIEGLAFRYSENLPLLYHGFCVSLAPGQLAVVMGPSGAGKSTLAKLLQGFYQPTSGSIRIDNVDIRHFSANELRSHFGVVPQETTLFSGTILDNLRMANPFASFEQVVAACRMAEIHSVIESLPNGYQTEIGERGAGLSGGQRQRLAIARALLKGPKILIFDEATSSLDQHTAEQIGRTINALKGKVTILFIAHALPKTLQPDQIVRIGERLSVVPVARPEAQEGASVHDE
ncbi:peptidase domain-containing ABC transporter [Steroidobacter sp. S1-65]|uniref:Peptidase domain-containing ABC transporter n=2 Tax=Steroidobacter gossypii TaxID=2805490 RepID=A0ABS1WXP7_9GAMM|nr:peptidase domain-containing ABC transporter [Steroidobacter gossypii]